MNKKLIGIGVALLIIGVVLIGATVYQELVEEPKPEDYHMTPQPKGKYEWRSRNPTLTTISVILLIVGLATILLGWKWKS